MDYNEEMLRLYFYENRFTKAQVQELLEKNPFDKNFCFWEEQKLYNNKSFAINIKKNGLINKNTTIQEIAVHENNSVGKYLQNDLIISPCSIKSDINKIKLQKRLVLFKGLYPNEYYFLKKLLNNSTPFITGICTKDNNYYSYVLSKYKEMLESLKKCELLEYQNLNNQILIFKNK